MLRVLNDMETKFVYPVLMIARKAHSMEIVLKWWFVWQASCIMGMPGLLFAVMEIKCTVDCNSMNPFNHSSYQTKHLISMLSLGRAPSIVCG